MKSNLCGLHSVVTGVPCREDSDREEEKKKKNGGSVGSRIVRKEVSASTAQVTPRCFL